MPEFTRDDLKARYQLFNKFALADQRDYYRSTIGKYRTAAGQVNRFRALFAFLTGLSAAAAGFIVQMSFVDGARCSSLDAAAKLPDDCAGLKTLVVILMVGAVVMPALGAVFNTLADLYQWDRMIQIYDAALENIEVADAQSPHPEMDDLTFRASLRAFTEGTLQVMQDETSQWGQSIRTPVQLETFVEEEMLKAARLGGDANASAEKEKKASEKPDDDLAGG